MKINIDTHMMSFSSGQLNNTDLKKTFSFEKELNNLVGNKIAEENRKALNYSADKNSIEKYLNSFIQKNKKYIYHQVTNDFKKIIITPFNNE